MSNFFLTGNQENTLLLDLLLGLNLFKSKKTTYNKRLATKTVADWELKVVVSRAEPVRITFDWRESGVKVGRH